MPESAPISTGSTDTQGGAVEAAVEEEEEEEEVGFGCLLQILFYTT